MKLQPVLVENILLKVLTLIILSKTGLILTVVMIIFWTVCNTILVIVFTIIEGGFLRMCHDGTL